MPVVELVVEPGEVELATDALWQAAPSAVTEEPLADGRVRLVADVADLSAVPSPWRPATIEVDEAAVDGWRSFAEPWRAGRRLVLVPAWVEHDAAPEDLVLRLDPGRVFGSGSHPSTRQALGILEDLDLVGARVLDVGSGSGVLSIAALLLGADAAVAIDVDPSAAAIAEENARRNGVTGLRASSAPVDQVEGAFEVVVANIGAAVLQDLAAPIRARVAPGGALVLAGLLEAQAEAVAAAYGPAVLERAESEAGWRALLLRV